MLGWIEDEEPYCTTTRHSTIIFHLNESTIPPIDHCRSSPSSSTLAIRTTVHYFTSHNNIIVLSIRKFAMDSASSLLG